MKKHIHKYLSIRFYKKRISLLLIITVILSLIVILSFGYFRLKGSHFLARFHSPPSLDELASQILKDCQYVKFHQGCYEKKIPRLMDSPYFLNMQQGFEVMSKVQEQDKSYGYCHVTAHYLSEKEVRSNPDNWKSVITKCPEGACANGCVHGVFMEKFHAERFSAPELESMSSDLRSVCVKNELWQPTRSETNGCFHALGHTAMYLSGADIPIALEFCKNIGSQQKDENFTYSCYQGLFMQVFQPLEAEDKVLVSKIRPTRDTVSQFCSPYEGLSRLACLSESWPLFYPGLKEPKNFTQFCAPFADKDKKYCYSTVLNILTSNTQLNIDFMHNYCSQLTTPTPGNCLGEVALRLLNINIHYQQQAINVCKGGEDIDAAGECYQRLINSGNSFLKNPNEERKDFCDKFPDDWQQKCLAKKT